MASASMRYTVRQSWPLSGTRSSWHRRPIDGIGRECGKLRLSPCCSLPSRYPASIGRESELAAFTTDAVDRECGKLRLSPCCSLQQGESLDRKSTRLNSSH